MARRGDGAAVGAVGWSVTDSEGTDEVYAAGSPVMAGLSVSLEKKESSCGAGGGRLWKKEMR